MRCLGVSARGAGGLLCVTPMFAFFGGASLRALSVEPCASERSRHRYVPPWRASVRVVGIWHWFVKGCPTIGTMEPEEDTERIAKLREQRRADRERRRRAHQQAQQAAAASDERQAPAQADESQEAPAQAVQRDEEEPVVAHAVAAPISAVVVADVAPVAAVAFVPPAPPAPQQERYPDVDAELLGEEIRRERTQIDGFDARATAVCDLLAEAERKLMEAERMEAALLADDGDE